eukprot:gene4874-5513_t
MIFLTAILFIAIGTCAVLLNSIEIYLLSKRWSLLKAYDQILLSLAASDLSTGLFTIVYGICVNQIEKDTSEILLIVVISTFIFTGMNLMTIGIDRFIMIRYPIKHRLWLTRRRMQRIIAIGWAINLSIEIVIPIILIIASEFYTLKWLFMYTSTYGIIITGIYLFISYTLIIGSIIQRIRLKARQQQSNTTSSTPEPSKDEFAIMLNCIRIVVEFIVTTYPFAIYCLDCNNKKETSKPLAALLLSNNILNPLFYFFKTFFKQRNRNRIQNTR